MEGRPFIDDEFPDNVMLTLEKAGENRKSLIEMLRHYTPQNLDTMRKSNLPDFRFDGIGIDFSSTQLVKITVNLVHIIRCSIISPQITNRSQLAS